MTLFDRFATTVSEHVARAWFFAFCVLLVVVWAPSYPLWGSGDTWQLVINTTTTILTFLLVALLQNTQDRATRALHRKLDALAEGVATLLDGQADRDACALALRCIAGTEMVSQQEEAS